MLEKGKKYCKKCKKEIIDSSKGNYCSQDCKKKYRKYAWWDGITEFFANI